MTKMAFRETPSEEDSFEDESLKELEEHNEHQPYKRRAETSSFSQESFRKDQLAAKRARTTSFSVPSLLKRILSLQLCLQIFLRKFWNFQLSGAALYLTNGSFRVSLPTESLPADQLVAAYRSNRQPNSLQAEELAAAYSKKSFVQQSLQQEELWKASSENELSTRKHAAR